MKILLVTSHLYPEIGGPFNVITSTAKQLILLDKKIKIRVVSRYGYYSLKKKLNLFQLISKFDIIHFFGAWDLFHIKVCLLTFFLRKKLIISPIGLFEKWALEQKKIKKKIAMFLYQKYFLNRASAIHVTSNAEFENLKLFTDTKIKILPHGINQVSKKQIKKNFLIKKKKILYFSRLHKKKGLDELLEAWLRSKPNHSELHIYGPDYGNYKKKLISDIFKKNKIYIHNPVFDNIKKYELFKNFDLLILPSKSENFGFVILEALNLGLPVITTIHTPWKIIKDKNAGWVINKLDDLDNVFKELNNMKKKDFIIKSRNALNISQKFHWSSLTKKYFRFYKSIFAND